MTLLNHNKSNITQPVARPLNIHEMMKHQSISKSRPTKIWSLDNCQQQIHLEQNIRFFRKKMHQLLVWGSNGALSTLTIQ